MARKNDLAKKAKETLDRIAARKKEEGTREVQRCKVRVKPKSNKDKSSDKLQKYMESKNPIEEEIFALSTEDDFRDDLEINEKPQEGDTPKSGWNFFSARNLFAQDEEEDENSDNQEKLNESTDTNFMSLDSELPVDDELGNEPDEEPDEYDEEVDEVSLQSQPNNETPMFSDKQDMKVSNIDDLKRSTKKVTKRANIKAQKRAKKDKIKQAKIDEEKRAKKEELRRAKKDEEKRAKQEELKHKEEMKRLEIEELKHKEVLKRLEKEEAKHKEEAKRLEREEAKREKMEELRLKELLKRPNIEELMRPKKEVAQRPNRDRAKISKTELKKNPHVEVRKYSHQEVSDQTAFAFNDGLDVVYEEFGEPRVLQLQKSISDTTMRNGVIVRVEASTVSISDCEIRRNISSNLIWPILIPNTPGQDFVGRIVYVGDKAEKYSNYRQGDRVCAIGQFLGGNSRYVTVPCTKLVRVPEAVDAAEAACIVRSYLAAYQILYRTGAFEISHSHRILVTGASGAIGRALIEVAKMARAKVYGACSSRHKHFVQFKLGVPWVHSNPENWESLHDIDVVVDCVNYTGNFNDSKVPLARGGVLVCVGSAKYVADAISEQKNKLKELDFNYDSDDDSQYGIGRTVCGAFVPASKKKAVYQSSILGHLPLKISGGVNISIFVTTVTFDLFRNVENNFEACKDDLEMLFARLLRGKLKPLVSHRISLEHVMKAHRMVEYGGLQGTIVCLPHVIRS